ncbi:MAG TPA: hypothetical protein VGC42_15690, partial [Kofleriaceae bacterium]
MSAHRSPPNHSRALAPLLLSLLAAGLGCGNKDPGTPPSSPSPAPAPAPAKPRPSGPGLDLRLSNGKDGPPAFDHAKLAPARKLSDAEAS